MVGSMIIGIATGLVVAGTALVSGYGLLAAAGIYVLSGSVAMLVSALMAIGLASLRDMRRDLADRHFDISLQRQSLQRQILR